MIAAGVAVGSGVGIAQVFSNVVASKTVPSGLMACKVKVQPSSVAKTV
jgi:hypothetical protein